MKRIPKIRTRFNAIVMFGIMMIVFLQLSCGNSHYFTKNPRKFLSLVPVERDGVKLSHIEVHYPIVDSAIILDDRILMAIMRLNKADRIQVLKEYLSFRGDTIRSNKPYLEGFGKSENRFKVNYGKLYYPVEVEALYSFTVMLFVDYISISPVLMNTKTGKVCNYNRADLDRVYKCYYEWYKRMEKTNFSNLTWPLENSGYHWLGQTDDINRWLRKKLY